MPTDDDQEEVLNELANTANTTHRWEWRNRTPFAVCLRERNGQRRAIKTISKGGKYAAEWLEWEAEYEAWVANGKRRR